MIRHFRKPSSHLIMALALLVCGLFGFYLPRHRDGFDIVVGWITLAFAVAHFVTWLERR